MFTNNIDKTFLTEEVMGYLNEKEKKLYSSSLSRSLSRISAHFFFVLSSNIYEYLLKKQTLHKWGSDTDCHAQDILWYGIKKCRKTIKLVFFLSTDNRYSWIFIASIIFFIRNKLHFSMHDRTLYFPLIGTINGGISLICNFSIYPQWSDALELFQLKDFLFINQF